MRVGGTHTKRVDEVLSRIPLSPPWTVHEFLAWLEKDTGRPILLKPYPEGTAIGNRRCGVLYGLENKDIILFDPNRSERLQRQTIFHEVGHVLCCHKGEPFSPTDGSPLISGINPASIKYMMQRTTFDTPTEAEAELLGTKLAVLSRGGITDDGRGHFNRIISTVVQ
jgi:hypothetical protein